jgi:Protein of unknown function (DUF3102)
MADMPQAFDYGQLSGDDWKFVQDARDEIRRLSTQTVENVLAIGKHLIQVKERLGHGRFGPWLAAEFGWSERSASNFMRSYEFAEANRQMLANLVRHLDPSGLYLLAAQATTEAAREEVLDKAKKGHVTHKTVRSIVQRHKTVIKPEVRSRTSPHPQLSPDRLAAITSNASAFGEQQRAGPIEGEEPVQGDQLPPHLKVEKPEGHRRGYQFPFWAKWVEARTMPQTG